MQDQSADGKNEGDLGRMNLESTCPHVSTRVGPDVLRAANTVRGTRRVSPGDDTAGPVYVASLAEQSVCE